MVSLNSCKVGASICIDFRCGLDFQVKYIIRHVLRNVTYLTALFLSLESSLLHFVFHQGASF